MTDADTGDMVQDKAGDRVGGGKDSILRAAAGMLPVYLALDAME